MSISGPSRHAIQRSSSAAINFRVFNVTTTGTVNISDLTIKQGNPGNANGGGLQNFNAGTVNVTNCLFQGNVASNGGGISGRAGTLNVTNCTFTGNTATNGGGIYNDGGILNVTNCTFTGNRAGSDGGGIANDHYRSASVSNSTFIGNSANEGDPSASGGGAICNGDHNHSFGGFMTIINTTITGNSALRCGGVSTAGGAAAGELTVTNSTIVGNSSFYSDSAGGISKDGEGGPVKIKNTIVALNTGSAGRDVYGAFASSGFNLIGKIDGSTGFTAPTDQTGTIAAPLDPKIDPTGLRDNGGPTDTIALLTGSPAIDKGTSNGLTGTLINDQRGVGYSRIINKSVANASGGDGTDIGAFEVGAQIKAVSRKTHGTTGNFDIKLPLAGPKVGVECRKGGSSGAFKLILTFPRAITVASASVTPDPAAPGAVGNIKSFSVSGSAVTVNLTGVSNAQKILITLFGVSDGSNSNDVSVSMGVLLGDASGNGSVKDADVTLTQSKVGQAVSTANFREDVDINGSINSTDVNLVTTKKGTALP
jgi:predicted outer membrane repeat protein